MGRRNAPRPPPAPARERAADEERFGGPFAQVNGESNAVPVVAGETHHAIAARVVAEDGTHLFGKENRTAPTVRDAHGGKSGVQVAYATFQPAKTIGGLAPANIIAVQIVHAVFDRTCANGKARRRPHIGGDKAGAEEDAIRFGTAPPQKGENHGVKQGA